ncbi:hypothetical protein PINS_up002035 [Pythium insidiosum]|nr:hypothetical protein PINS_up002035 [Pythium insidiosum]
MESWTDYFTSHFYALKMRPVSAFDPSGFMILITLMLLSVGVVLASAQSLVHRHGVRLRSQVEKNLQDISDYVAESKTKVEEHVQYVKGQAIVHSGHQGFIAEMLSWAYLSRLAFSVAIFALASYLNALASVIAGWRTPNVVILNLNKQDTGEKTLPDLGHDLFKFVMTKIYGHTTNLEWFDLPDEFIGTVGSVVGLLLVVHPRRLLILRRFCAIFACINLMRACCVTATSLPDASPLCISQFESGKGLYKSMPMFPKAFFRAFKVLTRPSQHITCGDMIFSGHSVFLMLCAMIVRTYCVESELNTPFTRRFPYVLWMLRYFVYAGAAGGIFAIIGTRLHYTLDVLIAMYITTQVWLTYHWLSANPRSSFRVIKWLEHDDVHFIDMDAYRKARRSGSLERLAESVDAAQTKKDD